MKIIISASVLATLCAAILAIPTHAAVTNVAWYRLGENDPGAASGVTATNTANLLGFNPLKPIGSPRYTNAVSPSAATGLGSSLAVHFSGTTQCFTNAIVSTALDNFGVEAWVRPNTTNASGSFIVQNGINGLGAWDIRHNNGTYFGVLAPTNGASSVGDGTAIASPGVWAHVAMVRNNGTNRFYFNGAPNGPATTNAPGPPLGHFTIGANFGTNALGLLNNSFFNGIIDEVRVFTFAPGQFSTNDLLFNALVTTLPASGFAPGTATLNGRVGSAGFATTAWFEWGTTTNLGNLTAPQAFGSAFSTTNFSQVLTGLTAGVVYFRAVATNNLGLVFGAIQSFTLGPTVQTFPATGLTNSSATLNGVANPNTNATSAWFEYGFTTNYGAVTAPQPLGSGASNTNFSQALTNLFRGVTYHFRAVASNSFGVVFGADQSFRVCEQIYLKASNTGTGDRFGRGVAISGDTLVVGAIDESSNATGVNGDQANNSATSAGAAYVFVRSGTNWIQQAYLKASNSGVNDHFGESVAVSGDTLLVGAVFESSNATGVNGDQSNNTAGASGAAYVFVRNRTNWSQQAYLKPSNTGVGDQFGYPVAVSGDTAVVGARFEDSGATGVNGDQTNNTATDAGAAYVFVRTGTNWTQQAYLKASNTASNDVFGFSVAVSGETIVVGALEESSNATGVNGDQTNNNAVASGAAYVFVRSGTNWSQQAYLKASNTGTLDHFGDDLALSGDTLLVGAPLEDSNATGVNGDQANNAATDAGAAYVFVRSGTNWIQQAYLKASNTGSNDSFGDQVAVSGHTVVVGAVFEDSNATSINGDQGNNTATNAGAAYLFVRTGTNWSQQAYLKASNPGAGDRFGEPVAVSGGTVVVGARFEGSDATGVNGDQSNDNAPISGAAYVFDFGQPTPPLLTILGSGPAQVTLSWRPPTPGFALQESLSLTPLSWSNSPSGETNPITLPATGQTRFFRLFKP